MSIFLNKVYLVSHGQPLTPVQYSICEPPTNRDRAVLLQHGRADILTVSMHKMSTPSLAIVDRDQRKQSLCKQRAQYSRLSEPVSECANCCQVWLTKCQWSYRGTTRETHQSLCLLVVVSGEKGRGYSGKPR